MLNIIAFTIILLFASSTSVVGLASSSTTNRRTFAKGVISAATIPLLLPLLPSVTPAVDHSSTSTSTITYPTIFSTYLTKILINYDPRIRSIWFESFPTSSTSSPTAYRSLKFSELSKSVSNGLVQYSSSLGGQNSPQSLLISLLRSYSYSQTQPSNNEFRRQLGILFSLLPPSSQPPAPFLDQVLQSVPEYYESSNLGRENRYSEESFEKRFSSLEVSEFQSI
tara:strand:+ start:82 stop:753 length:672 start_codon:yes stop_codon:yes gene_type:complete